MRPSCSGRRCCRWAQRASIKNCKDAGVAFRSPSAPICPLAIAQTESETRKHTITCLLFCSLLPPKLAFSIFVRVITRVVRKLLEHCSAHWPPALGPSITYSLLHPLPVTACCFAPYSIIVTYTIFPVRSSVCAPAFLSRSRGASNSVSTISPLPRRAPECAPLWCPP